MIYKNGAQNGLLRNMAYKLGIIAFIVALFVPFTTFAQGTLPVDGPDTDAPSSVGCVTFSKTLRYGMTDSEVQILQKFLIDRNLLSVTPGNYFGRLTLAGVKQFQIQSNISPSGIVGNVTGKRIHDLTCGIIRVPTDEESTPTPIPTPTVTPSGSPSLISYSQTIVPGQTISITGRNISGHDVVVKLTKNDRSITAVLWGGFISKGDGIQTLSFVVPTRPCITYVGASGLPCQQTVLTPGTYTLIVSAEAGDTQPVSVQVATNNQTSGTFSFIFPYSGATLERNATYSARWISDEIGVNGLPIDSYSVYLVGGGLGTTGSRYLGIAYRSVGTFSFTIPQDITPGSGYQLQFSGRDVTGGNSTSFSIVAPSTNGPLTVSCGANEITTLPGREVRWTAYVSGGNGTYSYTWAGTDGLTGTNQTAVKVYATPGTKYATLTVVSAGETVTRLCAKSVVVREEVTPTPTLLSVMCSPNASTLVSGNVVTWTAYPTGGNGTYSYQWSGTDGVTGSNKTLPVNYSANGYKYQAVSVVSGNQGVTSPCVGSVLVTGGVPTPTPSPSPTPSPLPDFSVDSVSVRSTTLTKGTDQYFTVYVRNTGGSAQGIVRVRVRNHDLSSSWGAVTDIVAPAAGAVVPVVVGPITSYGENILPGTYTFDATVDANYAILESNEANNVQVNATTFVVQNAPTPTPTSIPVTLLSPNGGEVFKVGDQVAISWRAIGLTNQNNSIGINIIARFPGAREQVVFSKTTGNAVLANGTIAETGSTVWSIPTGLTPGTYIAYVSSVSSWDESNTLFTVVSN